MVYFLTTLYYWAWDVCKMQLSSPSYSLDFSGKYISLQLFEIKEAFTKQEKYILVWRSIKSLNLSLLYKTMLIKASSRRCCGKAHSTCPHLHCLCTFHSITLKNNLNERTITSIQTNTTQCHKWHSALLHVSIRKLIQNIRLHQFYVFFVTLQWLSCLNILHELPDDDSSEIETCSSVQWHFRYCVWLRFLLFYVKGGTGSDDAYNVM